MAHFFVDKFNLQYFSDGTLNFDTKVDTDGLNEGTDEVGSKFGKLGSIFETGLGVLTGNLMTEAVGKLQELGASVVDAGADYEQLVGGVQTLFANSFATVEEFADGVGLSVEEVASDFEKNEGAIEAVLNNANNAYRTSGLSINDYMETATSFAAALNSSTGSVGESAELTEMAIVSMADNANKMGSSMESIQNAYNGFSKQNYTMLDNLKLGYGGTKTEMERLVADASRMTDAMEEVGVTVDADSLSFDNIVKAIQVVQTEMGIAGTTSLEATETFSGSLAMLQSSWTNVITAIGSGENMNIAFQGLGESLVAFGQNAVKMALNILGSLPAGLAAMSTSMIEGIQSALPEFARFASDAISNFVDTVNTALPQLVNEGGSVLSSIGQGITENLPSILAKGVEIVTSIVNGFLQNLPTFITAAGTMISQFLGFIMQNLPSILSAGVSLLTNIVNGIINNLPQIAAAAVKVVLQLASTIVSNLPTILAKGIEIIIKLVAGIIQAIPRVIAAVPQIIRAITSTLGSFDWWSVGKNIIQGIVNGVKSVAGALKEAILDIARSALDSVKSFFGIASPSKVMAKQVGRFLPLGIAQGIEGETDEAVKAMEDSASKIEGAAQITPSSIISGARSAVGNAASTLTQGISEKMTTINVPLYIDGREFARAEAPYLNKQLAWEA